MPWCQVHSYLKMFFLGYGPQVSTWKEALDVENASPYGNAASVYTSSGAAADFFQTRFRAGMIGKFGFGLHDENGRLQLKTARFSIDIMRHLLH